MKAYFIHIRDDACRHYDNGVPFEIAARKINLEKPPGWLDPERIIIKAASLYRGFSGQNLELDRMPLFAEMKKF
jgi:hypothetical protein